MSEHMLKKEIGYKWKRAQWKCILDSMWKKKQIVQIVFELSKNK